MTETTPGVYRVAEIVY